MAWETRGKHRYFYKSVRINGRPRKIYFGRGAAAVAAEEVMRLRQETRDAQQQRIAAAEETFAAADAAVQQVADAAAILGAAHAMAGRAAPQPAPVELPKSPLEVTQRVRQLLAQRAQGDNSIDGELAAILDRFPELWAQLGDVGTQAIEVWLNLAGGDDALLKRAMREKLQQLRQELIATAGDPTAQLLADRVVATWLQLQYADIRYAMLPQDSNAGGAEFLAKRQQQAQRQHLAALNAWRQWRGLAASLPEIELPNATAASDAGPIDPEPGDTDAPITLPFVMPVRA